MTIILTTCPRCATPPRMAMGPTQAFCENEDCEVFCWDMTVTREEFERTAQRVDLSAYDAAAAYSTRVRGDDERGSGPSD